jgi:hypothetical protein
MQSIKLYFSSLITLTLIVTMLNCGKNVAKSSDKLPPEISISAPANGATISGIVSIQINATDNKSVAKIIIYVDGDILTTLKSAPWTYSWDTDAYADNAQHTIQAKAYDNADNMGESQIITVTINLPLTLTFYNKIFTDITITVTGQSSKVISPSGSVTYQFSINPGSISYHAETSGKTNTGTIIGNKMTWDYTHDVSTTSEFSRNLILSAEWFFIKILNNGSRALTPLYVNYGLTDQTLDYIRIPNDGVTYSTGYYKAYTNTKVRAYYEDAPSNYTYWDQGTHFTLPFTENQYITLSNSYMAKNIGQDANASLISAIKVLELRPAENQPSISSNTMKVENDYGKGK